MQRSGVEALPSGTRVDSFEVRVVIGAGGFGITYLAFDHELERPVALKEFCPARLAIRSDDGTTVRAHSRTHERHFKSGRAAFLAEARALAKFRHPAIVRVSRHLEQFNTAYIVMDYEHGDTLRARLKKHKVLDDEAARKLFRPLLAGLGAVHRRKFMHGDIKPANVILRKRGGPVLIDFGAARGELSQQPTALYNTYTPGYASPELHVRTQDVGPWTDVYGLGAILFHCVVGHAPPTAPARVFADYFGRPDPMRKDIDALRQTHPESTVETILGALELTVTNRLSSVEEFVRCWAGPNGGDRAARYFNSTHQVASEEPADNDAVDPAVAELIEMRLGEHVGIGSARRYAQAYLPQCQSNEEYCRRMAAHIEGDEAREQFVAAVMLSSTH